MNELSHPARGAWIETTLFSGTRGSATGRTPRGVRGLKLVYNQYHNP